MTHDEAMRRDWMTYYEEKRLEQECRFSPQPRAPTAEALRWREMVWDEEGNMREVPLEEERSNDE